MGASGWNYFADYDPDLESVLDRLREQVFREEAYYWPSKAPRPRTIDDLLSDQEIRHSGTHSILDIDEVIDAADEDGFGTLRPLSERERRDLFGTATPTRADFDRFTWEKMVTRWSAQAVVLHGQDGAPRQVAVWGASGD